MGSGNDGSVSVTVFGGVPPYSIHLDGNLTGPLTTDVSAGSHTVLVTDAFGCIVEEEAFVENPTGLFQTDAAPFSIHPNPVPIGSPFRLNVPFPLVHVEIDFHDIHGSVLDSRLIEHWETGDLQLSAMGLPAGVYFVRLRSETYVTTFPIVLE